MPHLPDKIQKAGPEGTATLAKFVRKWGPHYSSAHYVLFFGLRVVARVLMALMSMASKQTFTAGASSNQNMKLMPHRSMVSITSHVGYCSAPEVWTGTMMGKPTLSFGCTHWFIMCFKGLLGITGQHNKSKARRLSMPTLSSRDHQSRRSFDGFLCNQLLVKVCKAHSIDTDIGLSGSRDTSTFFWVQVLQHKMGKKHHVVKALPPSTTFIT